MSEKKVVKPVALAVGAALAGSFALTSGIANGKTVESPFEMNTLSAGYMLGTTGEKEHKDGEGKCGEKDGEGACGEKDGEGACGEKDGEGACGEKEEGEGKCGEGSCGAA